MSQLFEIVQDKVLQLLLVSFCAGEFFPFCLAVYYYKVLYTIFQGLKKHIALCDRK